MNENGIAGLRGKKPSLEISACFLPLPNTEALFQQLVRLFVRRFALKAADSVFGSAESENWPDVNMRRGGSEMQPK